MLPNSSPRLDLPRHAFTLVELLVVMAVIVSVMAMLVPAFKNIGKANLLTASGNQVTNLANFARENAMSKNAMTALILLNDPALADMNRSFALYELTPPTNGAQSKSGDWRQISKWEALGSGVIADQCTFEDSTQPPPTALPSLKYGATAVSSYKYVVFLPGGALLSGSTAQVRLCEGYYPKGAGNPVYTSSRGSSGTAANYFKVSILAATGRTKIDRP
jgi:prepilin-type N-terminal cleavage/methylation domain-containing protein